MMIVLQQCVGSNDNNIDGSVGDDGIMLMMVMVAVA